MPSTIFKFNVLLVIHLHPNVLLGCCTHLPQAGEPDEDSQGPNRSSFHLVVLAVGQPQQHRHAHQLRLLLQSGTRTSRNQQNKLLSSLSSNVTELTGSCSKASGGTVERASQVLICSLGFCSFCRAPFRGPLKTSDQKVTTWVTTGQGQETGLLFSASITLIPDLEKETNWGFFQIKPAGSINGAESCRATASQHLPCPPMRRNRAQPQ